MTRALVIAAALLAGCGSAPIPVPQTVQVPVPVACIDAPVPRPDFFTDAQLAAMDDYHGMLALWLDRRQRQVYEARLEAAMAGCWMPGAGGT